MPHSGTQTPVWRLRAPVLPESKWRDSAESRHYGGDNDGKTARFSIKAARFSISPIGGLFATLLPDDRFYTVVAGLRNAPKVRRGLRSRCRSNRWRMNESCNAGCRTF